MSNSMSLPNIAAPGEALSTVWYVERTVHVASMRKSDMSLGPLCLPCLTQSWHLLRFCVHLGVLDAGWLMLETI